MTAKITREVSRNGRDIRYVHSFCSACPYWFGFAWNLDDAYAQAERHLVTVHDVEPSKAVTARTTARSRA